MSIQHPQRPPPAAAIIAFCSPQPCTLDVAVAVAVRLQAQTGFLSLPPACSLTPQQPLAPTRNRCRYYVALFTSPQCTSSSADCTPARAALHPPREPLQRRSARTSAPTTCCSTTSSPAGQRFSRSLRCDVRVAPFLCRLQAHSAGPPWIAATPQHTAIIPSPRYSCA